MKNHTNDQAVRGEEEHLLRAERAGRYALTAIETIMREVRMGEKILGFIRRRSKRSWKIWAYRRKCLTLNTGLICGRRQLKTIKQCRGYYSTEAQPFISYAIPVRTVENWATGKYRKQYYDAAMYAGVYVKSRVADVPEPNDEAALLPRPGSRSSGRINSRIGWPIYWLMRSTLLWWDRV